MLLFNKKTQAVSITKKNRYMFQIPALSQYLAAIAMKFRRPNTC